MARCCQHECQHGRDRQRKERNSGRQTWGGKEMFSPWHGWYRERSKRLLQLHPSSQTAGKASLSTSAFWQVTVTAALLADNSPPNCCAYKMPKLMFSWWEIAMDISSKCEIYFPILTWLLFLTRAVFPASSCIPPQSSAQWCDLWCKCLQDMNPRLWIKSLAIPIGGIYCALVKLFPYEHNA